MFPRKKKKTRKNLETQLCREQSSHLISSFLEKFAGCFVDEQHERTDGIKEKFHRVIRTISIILNQSFKRGCSHLKLLCNLNQIMYVWKSVFLVHLFLPPILKYLKIKNFQNNDTIRIEEKDNDWGKRLLLIIRK